MKKTTKSAFHRGFTLIELMIVIVILGILMGTILPRLSGAQGRARDTARVADLNSIAQALELYYDDFGQYPANSSDGTADCIGGTATTVGNLDIDIFKTYFKGDNVPTPPQSGEIVEYDGGSCQDAYMYLSLDAKGANNQAYAIIANVEVPTKGNAIAPNAGLSGVSATLGTFDTSTSITDFLGWIDAPPEDLVTADSDVPSGVTSVYVVASGS